jgi:quercetin dioxygenase-like cupin family protein/DNA-binding Xre family transcriptional regulator
MEEKHLEDLGSRIKNIRVSKALSLDELAKRSRVSKSMISQIEGNKTNPTVAMIGKLAQGLSTDISQLLGYEGMTSSKKKAPENQETETKKKKLYFHAQAQSFTQLVADRKGIHFQVLTPLEQVEELEIYLIDFQARAIIQSEPHSEGTEEYLTVLEGQLEVWSGNRKSILNPGDFLMYHADIPHSIKNIGDGTAKIHLVVHFH